MQEIIQQQFLVSKASGKKYPTSWITEVYKDGVIVVETITDPRGMLNNGNTLNFYNFFPHGSYDIVSENSDIHYIIGNCPFSERAVEGMQRRKVLGDEDDE